MAHPESTLSRPWPWEDGPCRFCGGKLVRRHSMKHRTRHVGSLPNSKGIPRRPWICSACKRVSVFPVKRREGEI